MKNEIQKIVDSLIPLYSQNEQDTPNQVLWNYPEVDNIIKIYENITNILFPGRYANKPQDLNTFFKDKITIINNDLFKEIRKAIPYQWKSASYIDEKNIISEDIDKISEEITNKFMYTLPEVRKKLIIDVKAAYNGDPAAQSYAEIKLSYPGLTAIISHRIAHQLYELGVPLIPRIISEYTHSITGIDIHPGAQIGDGFFIDHGTGVVIGETTKIGNYVKLYQGVTLGAKSFPLDKHGKPIKHIQRHPTVKDNVIIYANSTILGGDTILGRGTVVAGNVFLTKSTPPNSLVTRAESGVQIKTRDNSEQGSGI